MILAAFFILGFGLCAAERTRKIPEDVNGTIFRSTLAVLQKNDTLHLLWKSIDLTLVQKCLFSEFLNKTDKGSRRTLGFSSDTPKINVTTTVVQQIPFPLLDMKPDVEGDLPTRWTEPKDLLYANKNCFVLEARVRPDYRLSCVVFGFEGKGRNCFLFANKNCVTGHKIDLASCDKPLKQAKKQETQHK
uniref:Putative secreted protein 94 n=1 Tax=Amblyomma cajennense TaxID=34607 RepID=A0A023FDU2_AMBCJ